MHIAMVNLHEQAEVQTRLHAQTTPPPPYIPQDQSGEGEKGH